MTENGACQMDTCPEKVDVNPLKRSCLARALWPWPGPSAALSARIKMSESRGTKPCLKEYEAVGFKEANSAKQRSGIFPILPLATKLLGRLAFLPWMAGSEKAGLSAAVSVY